MTSMTTGEYRCGCSRTTNRSAPPTPSSGKPTTLPLVTGVLHTGFTPTSVRSRRMPRGTTPVRRTPILAPTRPQAGLPPAERTSRAHTFPAPAAPDEEVWLELSATCVDTRTKGRTAGPERRCWRVRDRASQAEFDLPDVPDGASHLGTTPALGA